MSQKKRLLKKEKSKEKLKLVVILSFCFVVVFLLAELIYFNFSFGKVSYVSPVAKNRISQVALLEDRLSEAKIRFFSVSLSPDASLVVELENGGEVIFSSKKDIGSQMSSLQLILSRLTIEGKKLKILDFRFDNPIVSF